MQWIFRVLIRDRGRREKKEEETLSSRVTDTRSKSWHRSDAYESSENSHSYLDVGKRRFFLRRDCSVEYHLENLGDSLKRSVVRFEDFGRGI